MNDGHRGSTALRRALLVASLLLLLAGSGLYVARIPLLVSLAGFLRVDDPLQPADLIFVLNGEVDTRPFHAAELWHRGLAPEVLIAQAEDSPASELGLWPNETDVNVRIMQELGVPAEAITVIAQDNVVTSTRDEAVALREHMDGRDVERVILVTSASHTRRARWIMRKALAGHPVDLLVSAAPHYGFDETDWWRDERGLLTVMNEYLKFAYYLAVY